jgi:cytochrome c556
MTYAYKTETQDEMQNRNDIRTAYAKTANRSTVHMPKLVRPNTPQDVTGVNTHRQHSADNAHRECKRFTAGGPQI